MGARNVTGFGTETLFTHVAPNKLRLSLSTVTEEGVIELHTDLTREQVAGTVAALRDWLAQVPGEDGKAAG